MSIYEMIDYDTLLDRAGINHAEQWQCGAYQPDEWQYNQANLTYDDIYATPPGPDPALGQPFGAHYDGRAQRTSSGGLCLTSDINVNGLVLNHRDQNNTVWLCTDIEGWWTLPPSEFVDVPKPYWDGSLLTTGRYQSRAVTISGCFIPEKPEHVWYNRDLIIRAASIVRGMGILATCGNATGNIDDLDAWALDPWNDPSKMSLIQMADVPMIQTTKGNGFTEFQLNFRCVNPAKVAVDEHSTSIQVGSAGTTLQRKYSAFSKPFDPVTEPETTTYAELRDLPGTTADRHYPAVKYYDISQRIPDEDDQTPTDLANNYLNVQDLSTGVHNAGNYFAFPIYVFGGITGLSPDANDSHTEGPLTVTNNATHESMQVINDIADDHILIVDTGARRVSYEAIGSSPSDWSWDDRRFLSLTSDWVSLAPGGNALVSQRPGHADLLGFPTVFWRDTWIG